MNKRISLHVKGLVQGVGFRPFVYALAKELNLHGFVQNSSSGVVVQIQATDEKIDEFIHNLKTKTPPLCKIQTIKKTYIPLENEDGFYIKKSDDTYAKNAHILPDMAVCKDCLKELNDKKNKRYEYAFINCTNCGPRYSIIQNIPYDRKFTSMSSFYMCDECKNEYENPLNRRYHAQPISCKNCGPSISFYDKNILIAKENEAIKKCADMIKNGKIVAIKGIGGFHIVCDAFNDESILRLRKFKNRLHKPFAVMFKNIFEVSKHVKMSKYEKLALNDLQKPIVLLQKKHSKLSEFIAPLTDKIGCFLPNTPLHVILLKYLNKPIIATSANKKSQPIISQIEQIDEQFMQIIDGVLDYDRKIIHTCDDSVVQLVGKDKLYLRLSRAITPLFLHVKSNCKKNLLAVGAEQKNAIAFYFDEHIVLSPYIGGMDSVQSYELFEKTIHDWQKFYDIKFDIIIKDKHPLYQTSKYANEQNLKTISVNHHHAHILATMVDVKLNLNTKVLGIAWDGTGYGDDGSIWGGEFLICEGKKYKKVANFKQFKLLGGDKSIKNINRILYSMMLDFKNEVNLDEFSDIKFLKNMHQKNINAPLCSSVGRLFDAVYYICTKQKEVSYDGQSGMYLEKLYDKNLDFSYNLHVSDVIEYENMILCMLKDMDNPIKIATGFLNALANLIYDFYIFYKLPIVVGGGVFQNKTLLSILKKKKMPLYFPTILTPNDGSICVGQIAYVLI